MTYWISYFDKIWITYYIEDKSKAMAEYLRLTWEGKQFPKLWGKDIAWETKLQVDETITLPWD